MHTEEKRNRRGEGERLARVLKRDSMPAAFDSCRAKGGKIRTKTLSKGRFMRICILGGKTFKGEIKTKKK